MGCKGWSIKIGGKEIRDIKPDSLLKHISMVFQDVYLLLDEATASLDADNELEIRKSINKLIKNKTVIVIAID